MNDDQLNKLLGESQPPASSPALDERVLASYRKITSQPQWLRVFRTRISIPAPVAVLLMAVFVATMLWRFPQPVMPPPPIVVSAPIPAFVRATATCPEPPQPVKRLRRQQPAISATHRRSLANLAWTPSSRPEWRIEQ